MKARSRPRRRASSTTAPAAPRKLPTALKKRAEALKTEALSRLADRGFEALRLIREKRADVAGNLLDIGEALKVLQSDGVAGALGHASFEALCRAELDMSVVSARRLIAITHHFRRESALTLGPDRARALIELADATPEDDTGESLMASTLTLPSGEKLSVEKATTAELREAARGIRHAHAPARRGLTTSKEERTAFAELKRRLKGAGASIRTPKLVASRDEEGAWVELRIRLRDVTSVARAMTRKAPSKK